MSDTHITPAQQLLFYQFLNTKGLRNTLLLTKSQVKIQHGLQIVHDCNNLWILVSNFQRRDNTAEVYDSVYSTVNTTTQSIIKNLFEPIQGKQPKV